MFKLPIVHKQKNKLSYFFYRIASHLWIWINKFHTFNVTGSANATPLYFRKEMTRKILYLLFFSLSFDGGDHPEETRQERLAKSTVIVESIEKLRIYI